MQYVVAINEGINGSVVVTAASGEPVYALQEERVNRVKEYHGFPHAALDIALADLGLVPADVLAVCLANQASPSLDREGFLAVYEERARGGTATLRRGLRRRLRAVLPAGVLAARHRRRAEAVNRRVEEALVEHGLGDRPVVRGHHHHHHAAAAYFGCRRDPVSPHLVLTLDGGGDGDCAHVYLAQEGRLELLAATPVGHSVGNLYSITTQVLGMTPHEHEYKLMGLAAYSPQRYAQPVAERFARYLDLDPVNPLRFRRRTPEPTFELQRRLLRDLERIRFDTVAGGLQLFTEELMVRWVRAAVAATGVAAVVGAGGVFMNVKANKRIAELPEVAHFDVFPSAGDESLPFGAAWSWLAEHRPAEQAGCRLDHLYLGPEASRDLAIARAAAAADPALEISELDDPAAAVAQLLAGGEVVARCSGRMEFGARALGHRSILADPADPRVVPRINHMIKQRDFWMPFAPAVLAEHAAELLELPPTLPQDRLSPYMMHTFATTARRDELIAGVHAHDLTSRAQIVRRETSPELHRLITEFAARTGRPVVLNTSFNLHGWPIVMGAVDALDVLRRSGLTHLVVDRVLFRKRDP